MKTLIQRVADKHLQAQEPFLVPMVVVERKGALLGATDDLRRGVQPAFWKKVAPPYTLYLLADVPLSQAENLVDHFGPGGFSFRSDHDAWNVARTYVQKRITTVR